MLDVLNPSLFYYVFRSVQHRKRYAIANTHTYMLKVSEALAFGEVKTLDNFSRATA